MSGGIFAVAIHRIDLLSISFVNVHNEHLLSLHETEQIPCETCKYSILYVCHPLVDLNAISL